jgi:leader peptidase (prepilin peptidase)/N-methyltransferase
VNDAGLWIAIGTLTGLIAGSFLSTLAIRWPEERSLSGRSQCDACGQAVGVRDLVPVLSFLALGGRCRTCRARIDRSHIVLELGCAAIGASAMFVAPGVDGALGALFGWLLLTLAAIDLKHFWLPNVLTGSLALGGLAGGLIGFAPDLQDRIIGGIAGYASLALIAFAYRTIRKREGLGGGDPKLLGAIGLWLGWQVLPYVLIGASVAGLAAVATLAMRGRAVAATTRLPFGTLMAVAAFPLWLISR